MRYTKLKKRKGIDVMANKNTEKKVTLKEMYLDLLTIKEIAENKARKEFIESRIAQLEKKNSNTSANGEKKLTATQTENLKLKDAIYNAMASGVRYTISDLMKVVPELDGLNSQKVNALVGQMYKIDKVVERIEEKRRAYFIKIDVAEGEEVEE